MLISAVSIYAIEVEIARGRVNLPPQELQTAIQRNAIEELAVTHDHSEHAAHLEWTESDPWDRPLATQALLESCVLVSVDRIFDGTTIVRRW